MAMRRICIAMRSAPFATTTGAASVPDLYRSATEMCVGLLTMTSAVGIAAAIFLLTISRARRRIAPFRWGLPSYSFASSFVSCRVIFIFSSIVYLFHA
jgi:hypothetical protein